MEITRLRSDLSAALARKDVIEAETREASAKIADGWQETARKLASGEGKNERRFRHLVAADMASDIAAAIRASATKEKADG